MGAMPTTIRTSDVRELLALVPFQLGFRPSESAVLVSLRGARSRVGLVARVDLADLAAADGGRAARALVGRVVADGAQQALVVVYTSADLQRPMTIAGPDHETHRAARAAVDALTAAAAVVGPAETWVIGPRGYYAHGCQDRECCPAGGRPLEELQATRVGAQMVLEGVLVAPTREDLVRLPVTTSAQRKAALRAGQRWRARGAAADPGAPIHRWRRDGLALWRRSLAAALEPGVVPALGEPAPGAPAGPVVFGDPVSALPEPTATGRLLAALDDVLVRDAVLLSFVEGNERVADRLLAGETGPEIGDGIAAITDPVRGRRPDRHRTAAARSVLEHAVAHATRGMHAPSLTLLAVLAWWEGDGARAGVLADRALGVDPTYRLAHLVDQALRSGMPPGWVRAASTD